MIVYSGHPITAKWCLNSDDAEIRKSINLYPLSPSPILPLPLLILSFRSRVGQSDSRELWSDIPLLRPALCDGSPASEEVV